MLLTILGPIQFHGELGCGVGGREMALMTELLVHSGEPVPIAHLADEVWADHAVDNPVHAVQTLISRLRCRLSALPHSAESATITTHGRAYLLSVSDLAVDSLRFEHLLRRARASSNAGDLPSAAHYYEQALALWHGPALATASTESRCIQAERVRLEEVRLAAIEEFAEVRLRRGDAQGVVSELAPIVERHPFREGLQGLLMLALHHSGRTAEALARYQRTRAVFVDELGIDPGPGLRALHEQMLNADPRLAPAASRAEAELTQSAAARSAPSGIPVVRTPHRALIRSRTPLPKPYGAFGRRRGVRPGPLAPEPE